MIQLPLCLMLALALAGPEAEVAQQVIQASYGKDLQRVALTSDASDDIALARTLLENAQHSETGPALRFALAEQAYRLTRTQNDGYQVASESLKLLAAGDPDRAAEYDAQRLELELRRYRFARGEQRAEAGKGIVTLLQGMATTSAKAKDWSAAVRYLQQAQSYTEGLPPDQRTSLDQQFEYATTQLRTTRQIEQIVRRLQANPSDTSAAQSIVRLYVTEMDDSATASTYVQATGDEKLIALLALANQPIDKLTPDQCVELGNWYQELAKTASKSGRALVLTRAQTAYQTAMQNPSVSDQTRMTAKIASFQIGKQLDGEPADLSIGSKYRIVIWNQHNNKDRDRGTSTVNVYLFQRDRQVATKSDVAVPWVNDKDESVVIEFAASRVDRIRVEITKWVQKGGGLSEIQVFQNGILRSEKKPVRASASYDANYGEANINDGVTTSNSPDRKGYWLLPDRTAGWIDIYLSGEPR